MIWPIDSFVCPLVRVAVMVNVGGGWSVMTTGEAAQTLVFAVIHTFIVTVVGTVMEAGAV